MYFIRPPFYIKAIYPSALWRVKTKEPSLFLTFDDGPIPEVTPKVLQILKEFDVKATFFCVGDNIKKHPDVFAQLVESGHRIGNHTFNHINGWHYPLDAYIENVMKCEKAILEKSNLDVYAKNDKLFRPPYGRISMTQLKALKNENYQVVLWDVLSGDFDPRVTKEECWKNVLKYTRNGSVIVFHDSVKASPNMLYTLPKTIEHYLNKGYSFDLL